jgi:hypothetical protein
MTKNEGTPVLIGITVPMEKGASKRRTKNVPTEQNLLNKVKTPTTRYLQIATGRDQKKVILQFPTHGAISFF